MLQQGFDTDAKPETTASASGKRQPVSRTARNVPEKEESLPAVPLTSELLYRLLSGEIAFQRGDWEQAYVAMLSAAQQTRDPRLARRAAEIALGAKEADETLAAIRLWRTLAPESDEANQYYLSFMILGDTPNLQEARTIIEERLKNARPQTRALLAFQIQRLLSRAKDKEAGFALLQEVLAPYDDLPESHLAIAQAAYTIGNPALARQKAQTALKLKPDSELAILTLAQVTPDKDDALKLLGDFSARYPKAREVRMAYARMLVEQQAYGKARTEFEGLLKDQPDDPGTLYALGVLSAQTGDMRAAEDYLTHFVQAASERPEEERDISSALLLLAQIAEERNDTDAVLKWLGRIEQGEVYLAAQIKRAQIIAKRGDIAGARAVLHGTATGNKREQAQIIIAEGQILREANRLGEAMEVLKEGIARFPENTDLLYDYAMIAEKRNDLEAMETSLRKIMVIAPNNQHAYNALGYSLAERNIRLDEAYALIEKALQLAPDDPFILDSMGWVYFRLGKLKEAESYLRRAYTLRQDVEIAAHLGEVLWATGQREAAQQLWREAHSKDPQNDTLKSTLARLNVSL